MQSLKSLVVFAIPTLIISQSQDHLKRCGLPRRQPANVKDDQHGGCAEEKGYRPTPVLPKVAAGRPPRRTRKDQGEEATANDF